MNFRIKQLCSACGAREGKETSFGDVLCSVCLGLKKQVSSKTNYAGVG